MDTRILVVDDEKLIVKGIRLTLEQDGFTVDAAYDGEEALAMAKENEYSIILLDVMLPKMDGFLVCRAIREFSDVPIIMLTAKGGDDDKIGGLECGADDYITKPFNILEVKARIRAIMRRSSGKNQKEPVKGTAENISDGFCIDENMRNVRITEEGKTKVINLTTKEFEVLSFLYHHPGKVYSREELLSIIWGADYPGDERTVDVHIRRLREKIEKEPGNPGIVRTKWGMGYYYAGDK